MKLAEKYQGFAKELSHNQIILITILGNATTPLVSQELQYQFDLISKTSTKYSEIEPMVNKMRAKGYDIRSKKYIGYWLPENFK